MDNKLVKLETKVFDTPEGQSYAVMMAVNIYNKETAPQFVDEAFDQMKMQIMMNPTMNVKVLITMLGVITAEDLKALVMDKVSKDPLFMVMLKQLISVDIIHGDEKGAILDQAKLV